jgi:hypothetical protein
MLDSNEAKARAEASFKRKEQQAQEGVKAWTEYQERRRAEDEKTERLRALRLAKEETEASAKKRSERAHAGDSGTFAAARH